MSPQTWGGVVCVCLLFGLIVEGKKKGEREREKKRAERDGDPNTFTKKSTEQNWSKSIRTHKNTIIFSPLDDYSSRKKDLKPLNVCFFFFFLITTYGFLQRDTCKIWQVVFSSVRKIFSNSLVKASTHRSPQGAVDLLCSLVSFNKFLCCFVCSFTKALPSSTDGFTTLSAWMLSWSIQTF